MEWNSAITTQLELQNQKHSRAQGRSQMHSRGELCGLRAGATERAQKAVYLKLASQGPLHLGTDTLEQNTSETQDTWQVVHFTPRKWALHGYEGTGPVTNIFTLKENCD